MDKYQLLKTLQDERAAWETLLASIDAEQMRIPGVTGNWSIKDVIAHITAWEQRPVAWVEAIHGKRKPTPAPWLPNLDEDQTNAWIFEANKGRSLEDVRADAQSTFERLIQGIQQLDEALINQPLSWLNNSSLCDSISGNTWEHYQTHSETIREWLAAAK